ncbi:MAG: DUF1211 domain-containing protein [Thaumarchaeota archaeon]|nr:DUF1211 domain-containing protein [Nitrososphaerota archaeon]
MSEATPQVPRPRIQGISDLIFGLALSLGAIQFVGSAPRDYGTLVADLSAFAFSFFILISIWNRYTTTMSVIPVETGWVVRLNMALLFLVAIEPFLFNLLVIPQEGLSSALASHVSQFYAADVGGMNLILAYFTHVLTMEEKRLIPGELVHRFRNTRDFLLLVSAVFFVSALPVFWDVMVGGYPVRVVIWVVTLPLIAFSRAITSRL